MVKIMGFPVAKENISEVRVIDVLREGDGGESKR